MAMVMVRKPTMFQMMVDCIPIDDVFDWHEGLVTTDEIKFFANPRGHLGASLTFDQLKDHGIDNNTIGSVCFRFSHEEKTISVLIFKTGKIKISGGYALQIIAKNDATLYDTYLDSIVAKVQDITKLTCGVKNITCLNGQLHIDPLKTTTELAAFVKKHQHKFAHVKQPLYDVPGRRGAYKLYLSKDTKTHIAVDIKGKTQIFAAKSFEELFFIFRIFD